LTVAINGSLHAWNVKNVNAGRKHSNDQLAVFNDQCHCEGRFL